MLQQMMLWALASPLLGLTAHNPVSVPLGPQVRMADARYVALGYESGRGFVPESEGNVMPEVRQDDRDALATVRELLGDWGRYVITSNPKEADLLIGVRATNLLALGGSVAKDARGSSGARRKVVVMEVASPDNVLAVYQATSGRPVQLLWRESERKGRLGSTPSLFQKLRSTVDALPTTP